jgi:GT2 family glycosyltransferase
MRSSRKWLTVSVVSHGQGGLVASLLEDLDRCCDPVSLDVVLTLNTPEPLTFKESDFRFPLTVIGNPRPKGFGANHNAAFRSASGSGFCVLNPDVRFSRDPFGPFRSRLEDPRVGVTAPLVTDFAGRVEDSARRMPTPARILRRMLCGRREEGYDVGAPLAEPDWVAGIFMLFPAHVFRKAGGFDERYHMYCEDVDLCTRLRLLGYRIVQDRSVRVVHDARRDSHRKWIHLAWHVRSLTRFFLSDVYEEARRG